MGLVQIYLVAGEVVLTIGSTSVKPYSTNYIIEQSINYVSSKTLVDATARS
ncbi:MAG TPA: hypothetical protein VE223_03425 [Nitrososphaeraceae archaeon]|nr:hypothetical protein [Nitrososphaeraceae archaeon]